MTERKTANDNSDLAADKPANDNYCLSDDLLRGADEIALWMFGDRNQRRMVYHLCATSRLPHAKIGSMICARKSVLLAWIKEQENRSVGKARKTA